MKKKLLIISSHPIQYNAPLFKLLSERGVIHLKVFYTWGQSENKVYDPGFGKIRKWDIPLTDGYDFEFIENVSSKPGSHHFMGINNPTVISKIELYNPDAILVFGWSFISHLKILRHFKSKIPVWFRGDSNLIDEPIGFSVKKIFRRLFLKWVFSNIDKAFYVGKANKEYFVKHGLKEDQLIFAPHAIDNMRFVQSVSNDFRKTLKIPDSEVVFIFAGKLEEKKNPEFLIRAFVKLETMTSHLIIVGNGAIEDKVKHFVAGQEKDIKSRIHFLPFQNQTVMPDIYKSGDVFCLVSQGPGETWGLAVNEAMACCCAIITTDKCGCSVDLVRDNVNGFVVKSNDIDQLIEKMLFMSSNRQIVKQMGVDSQNIIKDWSYENVCRAIESSF